MLPSRLSVLDSKPACILGSARGIGITELKLFILLWCCVQHFCKARSLHLSRLQLPNFCLKSIGCIASAGLWSIISFVLSKENEISYCDKSLFEEITFTASPILLITLDTQGYPKIMNLAPIHFVIHFVFYERNLCLLHKAKYCRVGFFTCF